MDPYQVCADVDRNRLRNVNLERPLPRERERCGPAERGRVRADENNENEALTKSVEYG